MELVQVTAHFNDKGEITPREIIHGASKYHVESTGRRWEDESGLHILVIVPSDRVFELLFVPNDRLWYLHLIGTDRPNHA